MTTNAVLTCDARCGAVATPGKAERWAVLSSRTPHGVIREDDICPRCVAKLMGWGNPIIMGTNRRVFDRVAT